MYRVFRYNCVFPNPCDLSLAYILLQDEIVKVLNTMRVYRKRRQILKTLHVFCQNKMRCVWFGPDVYRLWLAVYSLNQLLLVAGQPLSLKQSHQKDQDR